MVIYDPTLSLTKYLTESFKVKNLNIATSSIEVEKAFKENKFPLILQTSPFDTDSFNFLSECVWAKGNSLFIIDEADTVILQSQSRYLPYALQNILSRSRHRNLATIMAVRRPYEVPVTIRAFADRYIIFQTWLKRDILAVEDVIGEPIDKARELEVGQYIIKPDKETNNGSR